eukprot:2208793-Amphidinium_carterae.2
MKMLPTCATSQQCSQEASGIRLVSIPEHLENSVNMCLTAKKLRSELDARRADYRGFAQVDLEALKDMGMSSDEL